MKKKHGCGGMIHRLSDYIDGELDPKLCRVIDAHAPKCKPCKAFIATLRKSVRIVNKAGRRSSLPAKLRRSLRSQLKECALSLKKS
ncbi:MAG: zf-HC2 domain-containing protein [Elusimicrobiota bacterium]